MTKSAIVFDLNFNRTIKNLQTTAAGRNALKADWKSAVFDNVKLTDQQTFIFDTLSRTSVVIIQRQIRKALRNGSVFSCISDQSGMHTFAIATEEGNPSAAEFIVCDKRGSDERKCRWFPKDRNFPNQ